MRARARRFYRARAKARQLERERRQKIRKGLAKLQAMMRALNVELRAEFGHWNGGNR